MRSYDDWLTYSLDEWLGEIRKLTPEEREERAADEHEARQD